MRVQLASSLLGEKKDGKVAFVSRCMSRRLLRMGENVTGLKNLACSLEQLLKEQLLKLLILAQNDDG